MQSNAFFSVRHRRAAHSPIVGGGVAASVCGFTRGTGQSAVRLGLCCAHSLFLIGLRGTAPPVRWGFTFGTVTTVPVCSTFRYSGGLAPQWLPCSSRSRGGAFTGAPGRHLLMSQPLGDLHPWEMTQALCRSQVCVTQRRVNCRDHFPWGVPRRCMTLTSADRTPGLGQWPTPRTRHRSAWFHRVAGASPV